MTPDDIQVSISGLRHWLTDQLATRWPMARLLEDQSVWEEKGHRFKIQRARIVYLFVIGYHVMRAHPMPTVAAALERHLWLEHLERRGCIHVDLFKGEPIVLHCL